MNIDYLRQWIGRGESVADRITTTPTVALAATLDRDDALPLDGDALPPLWHWLYFLPLHRQSEIGPDGHAKRGGFLPPVPLPRRMWAGGRLSFHHPLHLGETISRDSSIVDVSEKSGRSGSLIFVRLRHQICNPGGVAITEEHDVVYRDNARPGTSAPAPQMAPTGEHWSRQIVPDEVLLFRYSALTFNGHRIHYDRRYVTEVEGYPGLVVHGPLIATLLADLLRRNLPTTTLHGLSFKAFSPLYDVAPFTVCGRLADDGKTVALWARGADGRLAMDATAILGTP